MMDDWLELFVRESNRIEGILRKPWALEVEAHVEFLSLHKIDVADIERLVGVLAPRNELRSRLGANVRVGSHIAPKGGPEIRTRLEELLAFMSRATAFRVHCDYETLHPFTDGNGRSGRALWLWHLQSYDHEEFERATQLGFLHTFYYQTLSATRPAIEAGGIG